MVWATQVGLLERRLNDMAAGQNGGLGLGSEMRDLLCEQLCVLSCSAALHGMQWLCRLRVMHFGGKLVGGAWV